MHPQHVDRQDIQRRMQLVMGEMPPHNRRPAPQWRTVSETRDNARIQRKGAFAVERSDTADITDWCPARWFIPTSRAKQPKLPAVLCLHQTVRIGKDEPSGLGGRENLHYARELAERGFVTFAPDYPRFGEYPIDCYAMGYASATMKGMWNHSLALDLLAASPEVDPQRMGCIGHSLGGYNTLFLSAFDDRILATVSSCGFNPFTWNNDEGRGVRGDIKDWSHAGHMPRIADRYGNRAENMPFDFDDVLSAIAPRALFVNAPTRDFFNCDGVRECLGHVEKLFPRGQLEAQHPECEHDFPPEVRHRAYQFLEEHLHAAK
jgi:dienelactone hydrolase